MTKNRETIWLNAWYGQRRWNYFLLPLTWLFRVFARIRRFWLTRYAQQQLSVPVLVVGNITVGGTGKTPLLIALVKHLQSRGWTPGVISRGYGGRVPHYPFLLSSTASVAETGDEPLSIHQQTDCAVCVGADRVASARLLQQQGCDILLSDDGLQHYRLGRRLELAVVDGQRGFGNGFCLPVGPLREPVTRLREVDLVVVNGAVSTPLISELQQAYSMTIIPEHWVRVRTQEKLPLNYLSPGTCVQAVAGIGNPERFYQTLRALKLELHQHDFPDHHTYDAQDFDFAKGPLVMTAKDAVKCRDFARDDWFYLAIHAQLPEAFWQRFDFLVANLKQPLTR